MDDSSPAAVRNQMQSLESDVLEGRTTSFRAARALLEIYSAKK
jgi:hypothetical protein